ncbi:hypothetical protein HFN60_17080 [Rhizobium leguminosarum]|uniref:hypothetical protein n=1 Tax=Rhizobium leguminosarum TaxID=384 RepID=UPI001C9550FC|nr:hypothetical protein [Rhizobium leguminosarum]MBY5817340.1 hypothetical protein [Rhizobium leguminosarum]
MSHAGPKLKHVAQKCAGAKIPVNSPDFREVQAAMPLIYYRIVKICRSFFCMAPEESSGLDDEIGGHSFLDRRSE